VTPVIYPTTLVPEHLQALLALNPLAWIVGRFRACVVGGRPLNPTLTAVSLMMSVVVFLLGLVYFRIRNAPSPT
jgi:ABC-type polysaccharide/polyol phosphate export permease